MNIQEKNREVRILLLDKILKNTSQDVAFWLGSVTIWLKIEIEKYNDSFLKN